MDASDGLPGPTDAWTTLAGLARDTTTIRLGTLMTSVTFRHPGVLAIQVAGVDAMSNGRVELGIGAGWFTEEHTAYGIPFPDTKERFARFGEQLEIVTGLWSTSVGERYDFAGAHYQLADSPALPKPVQSVGHRGGPPIIIGGKGRKQTPALTAEYADEFNLPFVDEETTASQFTRVRAACEEIGRDPDGLTWSNALTVCVGRDEKRSGAAPPRSGGRPRISAPTRSPARHRRWSTRSPATPRSDRSGSTCRSSTSTTSTTCT